jgi:hypothetical protein
MKCMVLTNNIDDVTLVTRPSILILILLLHSDTQSRQAIAAIQAQQLLVWGIEQ